MTPFQTPDRYRSVANFLYHEAELLDEQCYAEWEQLWSDSGVYWVPVDDGDYDPEQHVSIIYDDRPNLAKRVARLLTGDAHAQDPPSRLSRLVSNIRVEENEGRLRVSSRFLVTEFRTHVASWAGRTEHVLSVGDEDSPFRIERKTVFLANSDREVPLLAFIL